MNTPILSKEVQQAKANGAPIVALESTIIAHGMPYPQNLETAQEVEQIIRDAGATPATIAILDGRIHVGLDEKALHTLATAEDVAKASRRDIPGLLAQKRHAATTVAATMICAHMADIRIFATGGIGGVHRGAETTFDISADLPELSQTPVAVVSAGAKAILDLPLTLEWLETWGVPVVGFGTDELPAFYSRNSGIPIPLRLDTPDEIAALLAQQDALGYTNGTLIANPIPEAWSLPMDEMNTLIEKSIGEANAQGIFGKQLTPFLLKRITELTSGKSLASNIELVKSNAELAAKVAVAYNEAV
ncbi:MAG: pseudouridine-5'-phosphate glycosidase [Bacteroidia bacterium]